MRSFITTTTLLLAISTCMAQTKPYFYHVPDTPTTYTGAHVAARMVDGLGFRYYWASDSLTQKDLAYRPTPGARSTLETLQHLLTLSIMIVRTTEQQPIDFGEEDDSQLSYAELRTRTLANFERASHLLKAPQVSLDSMHIQITRKGAGTLNLPFWNLLNGPVADALWHVGQVVSFRRTSGNPLPRGVNFLSGLKMER
jgi:hypothetical protein